MKDEIFCTIAAAAAALLGLACLLLPDPSPIDRPHQTIPITAWPTDAP